jgi:hypothetical protein
MEEGSASEENVDLISAEFDFLSKLLLIISGNEEGIERDTLEQTNVDIHLDNEQPSIIVDNDNTSDLQTLPTETISSTTETIPSTTETAKLLESNETNHEIIVSTSLVESVVQPLTSSSELVHETASSKEALVEADITKTVDESETVETLVEIPSNVIDEVNSTIDSTNEPVDLKETTSVPISLLVESNEPVDTSSEYATNSNYITDNILVNSISNENPVSESLKPAIDAYDDDFENSTSPVKTNESENKEARSPATVLTVSDSSKSKLKSTKSSLKKEKVVHSKVSTVGSPASIVSPTASLAQLQHQRSTVLEERRNEAGAAYEKWLKNKTAQQKAEKDKQKKEEDELRAVIKARDDAKREAQTIRLKRLEHSSSERSGSNGRGGRSLGSRRGPLKPIRPSPYSESAHPGGGGGGGSYSAHESVNQREEQIRNLQQQQEFLQQQLQMQMQILQQQGVAVPGFNLAIGLGTQALQQQQQQQRFSSTSTLFPNTPGGQYSMQRLQTIQSPNIDFPLGSWTSQIGSNPNLPNGLNLQQGNSSIKDRVASAGMMHADKMLASFNPNSASAAATIDALSAHHNEKRRPSFSQKGLLPIDSTLQRATTAPLGGHGHGKSGIILDGDDELLSFQDSSRIGNSSRSTKKPKTANSSMRSSPKLSQELSVSSRGSPRNSRATIHSPSSAGAVAQASTPRRPAEFMKKPEWDPYFKSTGAISGGLTFPDPSNAGSMSSIGTGSGKLFADPVGFSPKDAVTTTAGERLRFQRPQLSVQLDKPSLLENLAQSTNISAASHTVSGKAFLASMSLPPGLPPGISSGYKQSSIISIPGQTTESSLIMPDLKTSQMDFGRVGSAPFNRPGMSNLSTLGGLNSNFNLLPMLTTVNPPMPISINQGGPVFTPSSSSVQFQSMISNFNIPGVPSSYTSSASSTSSSSFSNNVTGGGTPGVGGPGLNSLLQRFDVAQFPSEETPTTRSFNASISPRRDNPIDMVERAVAVSQAVAQRALPPGASGLSKPFTYTPLASPLELASLENNAAILSKSSAEVEDKALVSVSVSDSVAISSLVSAPVLTSVSEPAVAPELINLPAHVDPSLPPPPHPPPSSSTTSTTNDLHKHIEEKREGMTLSIPESNSMSAVSVHSVTEKALSPPNVSTDVKLVSIAPSNEVLVPVTKSAPVHKEITIDTHTQVTQPVIDIVSRKTSSSQPQDKTESKTETKIESKTEQASNNIVDTLPASLPKSEKKVRGKSATLQELSSPLQSSSSSSSTTTTTTTTLVSVTPEIKSEPVTTSNQSVTVVLSTAHVVSGVDKSVVAVTNPVIPTSQISNPLSSPSPSSCDVPAPPAPDDETVLENVFAIPVIPPPVLIEPRLPSSPPALPSMPHPPDTDNDILQMHRDGLARFARAVAPTMIPNLETSWERFGGTMEGVVKLWDACERRYPSQTAPFTAEAIQATKDRLFARDSWAAYEMEVQAHKLAEIEHHEWSITRMEKIQQRNIERCAAQAKLDGGPIEIPRHDAGVCVGAIFSSYVEPPSVLVDREGKVLGPAEKDMDPTLLPDGVSILAITSGIPPVPPIHEAMSRLRNLSTRDIRAIQYLRKATQALIITFGAMCVLLKLPTTWGAAMNALDDPELIDKLARLSTLACELHPRNEKEDEEGSDESTRKDSTTPMRGESGAATPLRPTGSPTPPTNSSHSPIKFAADAKDLKLSIQQIKLARKLLNKRPDVRAEVRTIAVTIKNIKRDDGMASDLHPNALERPFTVAADALVALLDWECSLVMTAIEQLKKQGLATQQQKLLQTLQVPSLEVLHARMEAEAEGRRPPIDEDEVSRLAAETTRIAAEDAARKSKELVEEVKRVEEESRRLKEEEYSARVALETARIAAIDADRADKERKMAKETEERARLVERALKEQQHEQHHE